MVFSAGCYSRGRGGDLETQARFSFSGVLVDIIFSPRMSFISPMALFSETQSLFRNGT